MEIDDLAVIVKEGFDSVNDRISGLEQEVHEMRKQFSHELQQLRADIEALQHVTGYATEIDEVMS